MSLPMALRAIARLCLGLALVLATVPLTSFDAEAGRIRAGAAAGASAARHYNRTSEENKTDHVDDATAPSTGEEPVRAQAVVKAKPAVIAKPQDADVPGCSPGMICTVCVAGCNGSVNSIIHAVPKQR